MQPCRTPTMVANYSVTLPFTLTAPRVSEYMLSRILIIFSGYPRSHITVHRPSLHTESTFYVNGGSLFVIVAKKLLKVTVAVAVCSWKVVHYSLRVCYGNLVLSGRINSTGLPLAPRAGETPTGRRGVGPSVQSNLPLPLTIACIQVTNQLNYYCHVNVQKGINQC